MTVFGKLLVFMNLVFSVVTGALIVFVFTTRANWQSAYEDARKKAEAAEAAYKAERASHENDLKQKDAATTSIQQEITRLKEDVKTAQDEVDRLQKVAATQTNLTNTAVTAQKAFEEEMKQIKDEREVLVKEKDDLRTRIVNIQKELDSQRHVAVNADLQAKNLVQRNANLLRQVEDLTVKVRELESSVATLPGGGSSGGVSIVDGVPKSAPPGVRGSVKFVGEPGTSLAQVDIGSDSGLSVGNALIVYKGSEYKGELVLTSVNPKVSVGKFSPARRGLTISQGDNVITSFGGAPQ